MAASSSATKHPSNHNILRVKSSRRTELIDVTAEVEKAIQASEVVLGICYLFVPHTTAGLIINEHDDPDVARDIEAAFDRLVPKELRYRHAEGNSDSHIKAALTRSSETLFIQDRELALGRWQGIFLCEFDGPRVRELHLRIVAA